VQVFVLGERSRRDAQAVGELGPDVRRVVELIRDELQLGAGDVAGDTLVACGLGDVTDDHVAACSARFVENTVRGARPKAVVFLGSRSRAIGHAAGLCDAQSFSPLGWPTPSNIFVWDGDPTMNALATLLGRPRRPPTWTPLVNPLATANALHSVFGEHNGHGSRDLAAIKWHRIKNRPLTIADVHGHLVGQRWVAPLHPKGSWPFVVIDIDRHNALQEKEFSKTARAVRKAFPSSFIVQSSATKGLHVYVRLPPDVEYERGALVVRAFLTLEKKRFAHAGNKKIATELTEVSEQPTRLPFGLGSFVPGSPRSLDDQISDFVAFATKTGKSAAFTAAETFVKGKLKLKGKWSPEHREKIRRRLLEEEAGPARHVVLPATDPWQQVVARLPVHLRNVAGTGVPAYGTRTRWTLLLIDALTELVEPDVAMDLMLYWLQERDHVSENIETDPASAEEQTMLLLKKAYKKNVGVPVRAWKVAAANIATFLHARQAAHLGGRPTRLPLHVQNSLDAADLYNTAFAVMREFFEKGVRERSINTREFAEFGGRNQASAIETVLTFGKWLRFVRPAVHGKHSRIYEITDTVWPRRPFEQCIHVRP
jgi:hypothetical protein